MTCCQSDPAFLDKWIRDKRFKLRWQIVKSIQDIGRLSQLDKDMGSFFDWGPNQN